MFVYSARDQNQNFMYAREVSTIKLYPQLTNVFVMVAQKRIQRKEKKKFCVEEYFSCLHLIFNSVFCLYKFNLPFNHFESP